MLENRRNSAYPRRHLYILASQGRRDLALIMWLMPKNRLHDIVLWASPSYAKARKGLVNNVPSACPLWNAHDIIEYDHVLTAHFIHNNYVTEILLVVHILYLGTSRWYIIYQTLSRFLRRRGWLARLFATGVKELIKRSHLKYVYSCI